MKFYKKIQSPYPFSVKFFLFFFQTIDARLREIRRTKKSSTSRSINFTHVKYKTRSKNVIYDVCERVRCCLMESRPPSACQIKMRGICRLFCARSLSVSFEPPPPPPPPPEAPILTYVTFWCTRHAKTMTPQVQQQTVPPPPPPKAIHVGVYRIG